MILDKDNTVDHPEVIITVHHSSSFAGKILRSKEKINSDAFLMSASQGKYSVKISDSNLFPLMLGQVRLILYEHLNETRAHYRNVCFTE